MGFRLEGYVSDDSSKAFLESFGLKAVAPSDVRAWLEGGDTDRTIRISSGGGSMFAGVDIYTILMEAGDVNVIIESLAGSAASLIAMGGRTVRISPAGELMIHNVSTWAQGDYREMLHTARELQVADQAVRNAYRLKTRLPDSEISRLMDAETWMSAQEALRLSFVDGILFDEGGILGQNGYQSNMERFKITVNTNNMRRLST